MHTILIVEDDPILNRMYQKKFEVAGFIVIAAHDGEEGLMLATQKRPDIALLDIMMPKVDGITMMDQIRKTDWGANLPIIILTNLDANDDIIQKVVSDHPSYYILKSNTTPDEIVEKVQEVLKEKQQ